MPTILSHPAPVLCLGLALGCRIMPGRLLLAGLVCAILPDLDVLGFKFGIAYANILGHRGLSHSLVFAAGIGLLGALIAPWLRSGRQAAFLVCAGAVALHILLDALTDGGLGVALFWPFSEVRWFAPWQPIAVSPFSPRSFLTERGARVLLSEARWVWLPSLAAGFAVWLIRRLAQGAGRR